MFNPLTGENMKKLIALIALISISGLALAHGGRFGSSYRGGGFRDGGYNGGRGGYYVGAFAPGFVAEEAYDSEPVYEEYEPFNSVEAAEDIAEDGLETAEDVTDDTIRTVRNILP